MSLTLSEEGVLLGVKVSPGASRERLLGPHDGLLKLAVRQPPERGRANRAVVDLVASALGLPRREVSIKSGQTSGTKTLLLRGISVEEARERIEGALGRAGGRS